MKNRTLSPLAIQRLKIIRAFILKEPERYDQRSVRFVDGCGTPGCVFGWAVHLFGDTCEARGLLFFGGAELIGIPGAGQYSTPAHRLFCNWTNDYGFAHLRQNKPYDRMTIRERAEFAARRIDHFIATDGAE